uniref:Uncharacterized protein n=1 Tax=Arundo donax TaxID=35708 RepID=A0A0A8Y3B9_ARUDO
MFLICDEESGGEGAGEAPPIAPGGRCHGRPRRQRGTTATRWSSSGRRGAAEAGVAVWGRRARRWRNRRRTG